MLVSRQPVFRKFWHAVMPLGGLAAGPQPFRLVIGMKAGNSDSGRMGRRKFRRKP